jgi:hypothetical protein
VGFFFPSPISLSINFDKGWVGLHFGRFFSLTRLAALFLQRSGKRTFDTWVLSAVLKKANFGDYFLLYLLSKNLARFVKNPTDLSS